MLNNSDFLYEKKGKEKKHENDESKNDESKKEEELKKFNYERAEIADFEFKNRKKLRKEIMGLIIFIIVFGITIPYFLYKHNKIEILEGYMPNLDLIANILGYSKGPFGDIFEDLYNLNKVQISIIAINYFALLGVTFLIALKTLRSKSLIDGWSSAFIMLLATYLVPGNPLSYLLYVFGKNISNIDDSLKVGTFLNWLVTAIFGSIIAVMVIMFESLLISNFGNFIRTILKKYFPFIKKKNLN